MRDGSKEDLESRSSPKAKLRKKGKKEKHGCETFPKWYPSDQFVPSLTEWML